MNIHNNMEGASKEYRTLEDLESPANVSDYAQKLEDYFHASGEEFLFAKIAKDSIIEFVFRNHIDKDEIVPLIENYPHKSALAVFTKPNKH